MIFFFFFFFFFLTKKQAQACRTHEIQVSGVPRIAEAVALTLESWQEDWSHTEQLALPSEISLHTWLTPEDWQESLKSKKRYN
jgi:hypothetical protein